MKENTLSTLSQFISKYIKWFIALICCISLTYIITIRSILPNDTIQQIHFKALQDLEMKHEKLQNQVKLHLKDINSSINEREFKSIQEVSTIQTQAESILEASEESISKEHDYSKGILLAMSNVYIELGLSLIREIRCLGNMELIQVYYCLNDLSLSNREKILQFETNIEMIDVCAYYMGKNGTVFTMKEWTLEDERIHNDPLQIDASAHRSFHGNVKFARRFQGYWIKPLAIYHTKIQEIIFIDADAILMKDPSFLRENSGYLRTGTIFFHDKRVRGESFFNAQDVIPESLMDKFSPEHIHTHSDGRKTVQRLKLLLAEFEYEAFGIKGGMKPSAELQRTLVWQEKTHHEMDSSMVLINKTRMSKQVRDVMYYLMTDRRLVNELGHGDKETFWLMYELAHEPYFISPWGITVLDSKPNEDLIKHPNTLCGSMAQFTPNEDPNSPHELLYINGKFLLQPFPFGVGFTDNRGAFYNINPTHLTPRYYRNDAMGSDLECLTDLGNEKIPNEVPIAPLLLRRRLHYNAIVLGYLEPLHLCLN